MPYHLTTSFLDLSWLCIGFTIAQPPKQWKDQEGDTITVAAALGPSNFGRPVSTTPHTTHSWKPRLYDKGKLCGWLAQQSRLESRRAPHNSSFWCTTQHFFLGETGLLSFYLYWFQSCLFTLPEIQFHHLWVETWLPWWSGKYVLYLETWLMPAEEISGNPLYSKTAAQDPQNGLDICWALR